MFSIQSNYLIRMSLIGPTNLKFDLHNLCGFIYALEYMLIILSVELIAWGQQARIYREFSIFV